MGNCVYSIPRLVAAQAPLQMNSSLNIRNSVLCIGKLCLHHSTFGGSTGPAADEQLPEYQEQCSLWETVFTLFHVGGSTGAAADEQLPEY